MSRLLEQREKRARIKALLEAKGLDAVVLKKGANVAWIIGGRAHIPTTLELSCMDVVVYRDRIVVVTNKIEAPRLKEEELSGEEELIIVNWFEGREGQLPKGERIGVDGAESDRVNLQTEIETLRRSLNDYEINRLKEIGADHIPQVLVWNKIDLAGLPPAVERDEYDKIRRVFVSAQTGAGIDLLRGAIAEFAQNSP